MGIGNVSNLNLVAVLFLVCASVVVLRGSHRAAAAALLVTAVMMPLGQQLVVAGLHFRFFRILILLGMLRAIASRTVSQWKGIRMDRLLVGWSVVVLLSGIARGPTAETFGQAYDALGAYFLFRFWIVDGDDVAAHLRVLVIVSVVIAASMAVEWTTHRNLFSVLGGVPEVTLVREGRFRCQGPFRHPILAGTFAATLFPLLVGLRYRERNRRRSLLGIGAAAFSTVAAASSGALMAFLAVLGGLALWPMRQRMRMIRRGAVIAIVGMAIVMKAPIWYLISRVSDITGGTGWHRSFLIDAAIAHVNEWWLIGSGHTAHWAVDPGTILWGIDPNNMDITNHYIKQGLDGGILGLWLFVATIVAGFRVIGYAVRTHATLSRTRLAWAVGVSLFANCTAFVSVSYFDQIQIFWFWLLAAIAAQAAIPQESRQPSTGEVVPGGRPVLPEAVTATAVTPEAMEATP